jgi:hypothetical protein
MRIELEDIAETLDVMQEKIDLICKKLEIEVNDDEFNELEEDVSEEEFEPEPVEQPATRPNTTTATKQPVRKGSKTKSRDSTEEADILSEDENEEEVEPEDEDM